MVNRPDIEELRRLLKERNTEQNGTAMYRIHIGYDIALHEAAPDLFDYIEELEANNEVLSDQLGARQWDLNNSNRVKSELETENARLLQKLDWFESTERMRED